MEHALLPDFEKRGGLIVAIVQDFKTKEVLMQGYINLATWLETLASKQVVLWSTSRDEIWYKGRTTDNEMKLKEVKLDCDRDSCVLMVEVLGNGLACHKGKVSCFETVWRKS